MAKAFPVACAGIKETPTEGVIWTKEAEEALKKNVPRMARLMAKRAIEKLIYHKGCRTYHNII